MNISASNLLLAGFVVCSQRLGDDHRETDSARANLAAVLQSLGQLAEAEELGRKSLEDRRKALGSNHPEVGKALNNLAVCLRSQRKFEEAESLFREALNTARQALGRVHPVVAGALTNLATVLEDQRKHAEAEPLYQHALQALMQVRGCSDWCACRENLMIRFVWLMNWVTRRSAQTIQKRFPLRRT